MNQFFAMMARMKYIERWALMRNARQETISEHSMEVSMLAHALAVIGNRKLGKNYNAEKAALIGLYHDANEIITGDMPTPVKYFSKDIRAAYGEVEKASGERLLSMLPKDLQEEYRPLIAHDESLLEWRIVKAADKLCAYVKCLEEKKSGNKEFDKAGKSVKKSIEKIDLPEVQDFMIQFVPGFSLTLDEISEE